MITVTIRPMREADVRPFADGMSWPVQWFQNRWDEKTVGFREALIAELDGVPVGTVSFNENPAFQGLLHLSAFDVIESFRNHGIGTQLVAAIESAARDLGLAGVYLEVNVDNHEAVRLYERLGYRSDGEPFINRWFAYDAPGTTREVAEVSRRMFKRFEQS